MAIPAPAPRPLALLLALCPSAFLQTIYVESSATGFSWSSQVLLRDFGAGTCHTGDALRCTFRL